MSTWSELVEHAEPPQHLAHLYGTDDELLARHVGRFLAEGLRRCDALIVVATPDHTRDIVRRLAEEGADATAAIQSHCLVLLDAETTLERLLLDGVPHWPSFEQVIGRAAFELRERAPSGKLRAFGEMVGLLWTRGDMDGAILLEDCWNRLLAGGGVSLFCAYPIDALQDDIDPDRLSSVVGAHSHVLVAPRTVFSARERVGVSR